MNIVFMGTPDFALPALRALLDAGHTIPLVVTAPDKPKGRNLRLTPPPVKLLAEERGIPVAQPESLADPAFIAELRAVQPDCIIVVAFRILPEEVFSLPPSGTINLHASLLPKYRGAAPINWALISGEKETGVTTFFIQKKVDTGNIILQKSVPLFDNTTAGELHDTLAELGAEAIVETAALLSQGDVRPLKQDDTLATPAPKLFRETCRIDWNKTANEVHNFIRGLSPHPTAWSMHGDRLIKFYRSHVSEHTKQAEPGTVVQADSRLVMATKAGAVEILMLQQEGRKTLSAEEFLRGYPLKEGERFD